MTVHMANEIQKLKSKLLFLCSLVEQSLWKAVKSLRQRDGALAKEVIDDDVLIDQNEVDVEEECLKILALHQPVAIDLRFIVTALKINVDLERIGDLSVNIAERSEFLARNEPAPIPFDFEQMAQITQQMLRDSLDALVNMNCPLAQKVLKDDDKVDAINREMYDQVKAAIQEHPEFIESLIHLLSVSRHLERIADHAVNIAEEVIYMAEGRIIRHKTEDYQ